MHFAILAHPESWYFRDLQRATESLGHTVERTDFTSLIGQPGSRDGFGNPFGRPEALIVRSMPAGSLEQVIFRMDVLGRLEAGGLPVVNPPKSLECAIDKYLTTAKLAAADLPVPPTIVCETTTAALEAMQRLGGDVVVKPLFGAEGRGIVRVTDPDMGWRVFSTLERLQAVIYLQKFIAHPGYDVRILVLDGKILGGMRRYSGDDFRTNVARQGKGRLYTPTDEECRLALAAMDVTGVRFGGIDLLQDRDGQQFVLEVNAVPGWRAFAKATGLDVAVAFIRHLASCLA